MRILRLGLWFAAVSLFLGACQTAEERAREAAMLAEQMPAACQGIDETKVDASKIGAVFLHGKGGRPRGYIGDLAEYLEAKGFKVETPEMPWSRIRKLDRSLEVAIDEIGKAVSDLENAGATTIVVGGQSMGGMGSLAYGARREGLSGVIVVAAGGDPHNIYNFSKDVQASVAEAKRMVAAGKGDQQHNFLDFNIGRSRTLRTTANIYLSYNDPEGPALMPRNAAGLKGVPLLWVYGKDDPVKDTNDPSYAFDKAPAHPLKTYVTIDAGHLDAPLKGRKVIEAWLKCLAGGKGA